MNKQKQRKFSQEKKNSYKFSSHLQNIIFAKLIGTERSNNESNEGDQISINHLNKKTSVRLMKWLVCIVLAAIHVAVWFFLITCAATAARLTDYRLPLTICVEPFNKVID